MAVAVPKRRTAPAPPPARTTPPKRKAAPKRKAGAPARAPQRVPVRAPQRAKPKTRRSPGARVIPLAGRTAVAVSHLPDSGLIVRMTRSRVWIGVLGVLLVGIVALNVVNLSFSAAAAKLDTQIGALENEIGVLKGRDATRSSTERVRQAGRELGLVQPVAVETEFLEFDRDTVPTAAARLAAISP